MGSGAKIITLDENYVIKVGDARVGEQGRWLQETTGIGVVHVYESWHTGYVMERLDPADVDRAEEVIDLLDAHVWRRPTKMAPNWNETIAYASTRAEQFWPEVHDKLVDQLTSCEKHDKELTRVRVHGDPTFENVMRRGAIGQRRLVLIDPLPARNYAPDLLAVDLGKLLQSSCGYEAALIGQHVPADTAWLRTFNFPDASAAKAFALFHIVRLLPYQLSPMQDIIKETVGERVLNL